MALNELSRAVILATGLAAPLLKNTNVPTKRLLDTALTAASYIGAANVMDIGKFFEKEAAGNPSDTGPTS